MYENTFLQCIITIFCKLIKPKIVCLGRLKRHVYEYLKFFDYEIYDYIIYFVHISYVCLKSNVTVQNN